MATLQLLWSWGWILTSGLRPWRPGLLLWWGFLELVATFILAYFLQNSREAEWNHMFGKKEKRGTEEQGSWVTAKAEGPWCQGQQPLSFWVMPVPWSGIKPWPPSCFAMSYMAQAPEMWILPSFTKWQKVTCRHRGKGKTINNAHQSLALKETLSQTKCSLARLFFSINLNLGL